MFIQEEEEGPNPIMVYERKVPHWDPRVNVPIEMSGGTRGELEYCLTMMENSIDYGQKAKLQLLTDSLPTQDSLNSLYTAMQANGFHTSRPMARYDHGIPSTEIVLRKGSPVWVALIPLIPTVMIVGLIAFGLTRIETISRAILPILLVTIGGIVITLAILTRKPVMETARQYIERTGRVQALPRTIPVPVSSKKA